MDRLGVDDGGFVGQTLAEGWADGSALGAADDEGLVDK